MTEIPSQLGAIDRETLTPLVRRATSRTDVDVVDWQSHPLHGGWEATSSLYRFSGEGRDRDTTIHWSLVLKVMRASPGREDPHHWNYWKREFLAYGLNLAMLLPGAT